MLFYWKMRKWPIAQCSVYPSFWKASSERYLTTMFLPSQLQVPIPCVTANLATIPAHQHKDIHSGCKRKGHEIHKTSFFLFFMTMRPSFFFDLDYFINGFSLLEILLRWLTVKFRFALRNPSINFIYVPVLLYGIHYWVIVCLFYFEWWFWIINNS